MSIRDEGFLLDRGVTNYWGYNSFGYFAPESSYAGRGVTGEQVHEFKSMVRELHRAGIEVILDVVYNHTAEGNHLGPDPQFQRNRQRGLLPPGKRKPALLHGLYRLRKYAKYPKPASFAAHHGQLTLLGERNARRRFSFRPRHNPGT